MKKLLVILAAGIMAAAASASSVSWNVSNVTVYNGSSLATDYRVWCFLSATDATTSKAAISVEDAVALVTAGKYTELATYRQKTGKTTSGAFASSELNGTWGAGDSLTAYAIVFNVADATPTAATHYLVMDKATVTFANSSQIRDVTLSTSTSGWTAVPEPTSGLLMLIGLAGLALKRKRA